MKSIASLPRDEMIGRLKEYVKISTKDTAVLAVDMHRGHLDPSIATMPVPVDECERVITNTKRLFSISRSFNLPIIHVVLQYRSKPFIGAESLRNPWWQAIAETGNSLTPDGRSTVVHHNIEGSPQTEIIPEIAPTKDDFVIKSKKRLSAFYGTDL